MFCTSDFLKAILVPYSTVTRIFLLSSSYRTQCADVLILFFSRLTMLLFYSNSLDD